MYRYCVYGIYEKDRFIHLLGTFDKFDYAEDLVHSCYVDKVYNYDGYVIKYEWCAIDL